jgi:hypothetical protein
MKLGVKRPIQVYIYHGLWIILTLFYLSKNSTDFGRFTLILITSVGAVSFINILFKRNYVEVKNNTLIINRDFFRIQSIDMSEIKKFHIEAGPFTSSKIILKDNSEIKYSNHQMNYKELKELMLQFSISVE